MMSRLFVLFFAVVTAVTPAFADGGAATVVVEAKTALFVATEVNLGRMTQAEAALALGSEVGAKNLVGALGVLKAANNGNALSSVDMQGLAKAVQGKDYKDAAQVVQGFVNLSNTKDLAGKNFGDVLASMEVPKVQSYIVASADSAEATFRKYAGRSSAAQKGMAKITGDVTRAGRGLATAAALLFTIATTTSPSICKADEAARCRELAQDIVPAVVYHYGLPETTAGFTKQVLTGFEGEKGSESIVKDKNGLALLTGADESLKLGPDGMPKSVDTCWRTGKPPAL